MNYLIVLGLAAALVGILSAYWPIFEERKAQRRRAWRDEIDDEWATYMAEREARIARATERYRTTHGRTLDEEAARRDERRAA